MSEEELVSGIAIVVDDDIDDARANINTLLKKIKGRMPCVTYSEIPKDAVLKHWKGVSFVLLDWKLENADVSAGKAEGVKVPDTVSQSIIDDNINFLTKLKDICFVPVFIFTNEDVDAVKKVLQEKGLYQDGKPNYIFVESKAGLIRGKKLFSTISQWIKNTPSVYVLKAWEIGYHKSKTKLFHDFYEISPVWPKILWKSFSDDGTDMAFELSEVITRNLYTRMMPISFDEKVFTKRIKNAKKDEVLKIIEGDRFIKASQLSQESISTGDLFKEEYKDNGTAKHRYYLNIRPQCDLLRSENREKTELYCLKGRVLHMTKANRNKIFSSENGHFNEKINNAIMAFIDDGKIIEFLFRDLKISTWKDLKSKRIGRILSPYINRIQQRYALYMQRQGLPRIPEKVIC